MDRIEFIVEVSKGPLGRVWLGRLLSGSEEGRVVAVRCLPLAMLQASNIEAVLEAATLARRVRHPSIAKVLAAGVAQDELRVVSEYVEGEYLAGLRALLFRRGRPLAANVVKRVLLDAMRATCSARDELNRLAGPAQTRLLFADTILVARFGETLIADPVVASAIDRALAGELGSVEDPGRLPEGMTGDDAQRAEVFGAALLLLELLVNRPLRAADQFESALAELECAAPSARSPGPQKAAALASVLSRALSTEPAARFPDLREFALAIESFGDLIASETEVRKALEDSAGTRLDSRKSVLDGSTAGAPGSQAGSSSRPTHRPSGANSERFSPEAPTSSEKTRARGIALAPTPSLAFPATTARAAETGSGTWLASSVSEPGSGVSEPPQARSIEARGPKARYGQRVAGLVIGLALLSALLAWRSRSSSAALRPDPALTRVTFGAIRPALAVASVGSPKVPTAIPESEIPTTPVPPSSASPGAQAHGSMPSPTHVSDPGQPAAKPSKSVFHPHNIAPYRPRGI